MNIQFVTIFPGLHLYSIDSHSTIEQFKLENTNLYNIQLLDGDWREQNFLFSFSDNFIEEAYKGFKKKGEEEYKRAKDIENIFITKYNAKFNHIGLLYIDVPLLNKWSEEEKSRARNEIEFQFYHVAQVLFSTIKRIKQMGEIRLEKFFCYAGSDGVEGLIKKFCEALHEDFREYLMDYKELISNFKIRVAITKWFPLTILRRAEAFKTLIGISRILLKKRRYFYEEKIYFTIKRGVEKEKFFYIAEGSAKENLDLYQTISDGLDEIQDLFSFQLGITSTFFEVMGLTLAVIGLIMIPGWLFVIPIVLAIIMYIELSILLRYSTGTSIIEQLNILSSLLEYY